MPSDWATGKFRESSNRLRIENRLTIEERVDLGRRLREWRRAHNFSQRALAQRVGILTSDRISKMECQGHGPDEDFDKVSRLLEHGLEEEPTASDASVAKLSVTINGVPATGPSGVEVSDRDVIVPARADGWSDDFYRGFVVGYIKRSMELAEDG